ncbi:hypothetical protein [Krasilnikovia sp. MM14-A1259]|uniref:hypothetical protein n=1 Tax=Krasilnikovia sp. MM14-A1259 TaxID=3373539 RepID=UPI00381F93C3
MTVPTTATDLTADYVGTGALRDPLDLDRLPPQFRAAYGPQLLSRPWFVRQQRMADFAEDLGRLFDLLASLPDRLFDGDIARYAAALGLDDRRTALLRLGSAGRPAKLGRADAFDDGTSYRVLEFNLGSELGAMDMATVNRAFLAGPEFAAFAERQGLTYVETAARIARTLRAVAAPVTGGGEPVVALLEGTGGLTKYGDLCRSFAETMLSHGLDVRIGEVADVRTSRGKITLHGTPIDVILRNFSANQILRDDPRGEDLVAPLIAAHTAGTTLMFTTFESGLYSNKAALAMLSAAHAHDSFSPADRALLDRVLPWTRMLGTGPAHTETLAYCREHRAELIIKPTVGFGGADTVVGWEVDDDRWRSALTDCAGRGYIAQRRVTPVSEPVADPATGLTAQWNAVLGVFITDEGYAGTHVRAVPHEHGAVIALVGNPQARITGVFGQP